MYFTEIQRTCYDNMNQAVSDYLSEKVDKDWVIANVEAFLNSLK